MTNQTTRFAVIAIDPEAVKGEDVLTDSLRVNDVTILIPKNALGNYLIEAKAYGMNKNQFLAELLRGIIIEIENQDSK